MRGIGGDDVVMFSISGAAVFVVDVGVAVVAAVEGNTVR